MFSKRFRKIAYGLSFLAAGGTPLFSQVDLTGQWAVRLHEDWDDRQPGPLPGDYTGIPINDAARIAADSWDAVSNYLQEHECKPHILPYMSRAPFPIRIWEEKNPVTQETVAIKIYYRYRMQLQTIWMDGRPHPSENALHAYMGFSTGKWEGNSLTVTTSHIKQGWIKRNGLPQSDMTTMVEHFFRNGDLLTHVSFVTDPVYLTEPLVRSETFVLDPNMRPNWISGCESSKEDVPEGSRRDYVPHYLPGQNSGLSDFALQVKLPYEAARGGADTIYPEYQQRLATLKNASTPNGADILRNDLSRNSPRRFESPASVPDITVLPVQGNVYMLAGAGRNSTIQIGDDGVFLADTQDAQFSDQVLAQIRKLSSLPIRYIFNTSADPIHSGGNETLSKAGRTLGNNGTGPATIVSHENVLSAISQRLAISGPVPEAALPADTFVKEHELFANRDSIRFIHVPNAHTDGDSIVYFRRSDVLSAGDIFVTTAFPYIDVAHGGSLQGIIDGLDLLLDLAIPGPAEEGGTLIIPGHGRLCDEGDLVEYRDMLVIIRDRIQSLIKKGATLEQIKAAQPTRDYDLRYGMGALGGMNTEMFIEAAYKSLIKK